MGDAYRNYLVGLGLAPRTIGVYASYVERAIAAGIDLETATPIEVAEYAESFPNTASTRRQIRTSFTHYWAMIERDGPVKAIRVPPKPRGRCRALEPEQARVLVKTAIGWDPHGLAVLFGLYLALRRAEIAALRWDRFDPQLEWYTVTGKGDVTAALPVHPVLRGELEQRRSGYVWLFPGSRRRAHVTPTTVWLWTKEVAQRAGIDHLQTHQLRHTAIATANDATGDLRAAQEFARHARPETTAIYTRATAARLQAIVGALDYL